MKLSGYPMTARAIASLFAISFCVTANAQFWKKHSSFDECVHTELRKYPNPTESAHNTVIRYCADIYHKIEIEKIKKNCNYRYDDAIKAGYSHYEIRQHLLQTNPKCLE